MRAAEWNEYRQCILLLQNLSRSPAKGKVRNPIAVIDNDVLLTILDMFTPEGALGQTGTALNSTNQKVASQLATYGNTYPERLQQILRVFVGARIQLYTRGRRRKVFTILNS